MTNSTGYTPFLDSIIEEIMPRLTPNGWKLFSFVWRKTVGFNKTSDYISYSQIEDGTGMSSKNTISKAIKEVAKFVIIEHNTGRSNMCRFDVSKIKGIETIPFMNKGTETEPFDDIKSIEIDQKGIETIHTINNHTIDNITTTTSAQELSAYFSQKTNQYPKGPIESQGWDADCQEIIDKAKGDVTRAKGFVDESLNILTELGYPRRKPAGLLVTIDNLLKPKAQRNGASKNGHTARDKQVESRPKGRTGEDLAAEPYYDPGTHEHVFPDGRREPAA